MILAGKVKKSFAKSAGTYARYAALQREVSRRLIFDFADAPAPSDVLDIGGGTGFTALDAAKRWPRARVFSIDLALPMAAEAKRAGVRHVAAADAGALPFKSGGFDAAVSSLAFQWAAGGAGFFEGIRRVLRPGGSLFFTVLAPGTLAELRRAYSRACLEITGRDAAYPQIPAPEETALLMDAGGFTNVAFEEWTVKKTYPGVDALFAALKGIGAAAAGRPSNPPRRDVLARTRGLYPVENGAVSATYVVACFRGDA